MRRSGLALMCVLVAADLVGLPAMSGAASAQSSSDRSLQTGEVFKDCVDCPEMVVVPAGIFHMGVDPTTPPAGFEGDHHQPVREVQVARFALGRYEVTRAQYAAFVATTGHPEGDGCFTVVLGQPWEWEPDASYRDPGFDQDQDHPVVCVSWADAAAYASWLSGVTGHVYRLPSEAELEYAARGIGPRYWGDAWDCKAGNSRDRTWAQHTGADCLDGARFTRAVGTYQPNAFGLFDVLGNVWEWVADCLHENYAGAPVDGSAWLTGGDCRQRGLRGGSWIDPVDVGTDDLVHPARRNHNAVGDYRFNTGFRVARTLDQ